MTALSSQRCVALPEGSVVLIITIHPELDATVEGPVRSAPTRNPLRDITSVTGDPARPW